MEWNRKFSEEQQPSGADIAAFVATPLWGELGEYLAASYGVQPTVQYSKCSMQHGWNVKYKKGGKALCTLYPMPGYFIALVVVGPRELPEAEALLPLWGSYLQELYQRTAVSMGAKWLMAKVRDPQTLQDVKSVIALRVTPGAAGRKTPPNSKE